MNRFILHGKYSSDRLAHIENPFKMIADMSASMHGLSKEAKIVLDWCVENSIWHAIELQHGSLKGIKGLGCMPRDFVALNIIIEDDSQACFMRMRFPELKLRP